MLSFLLVAGLLSFTSAEGASNLFTRLKGKREQTVQMADQILHQNDVLELMEGVESALAEVQTQVQETISE